MTLYRDSVDLRGKKFFVLSGEDTTLPFAEVQALVDVQREDAALFPVHRRMVIAEEDIDVDSVVRRGAHIRLGGKVLDACSLTDAEKCLSRIDFAGSSVFGSFAARIINLTAGRRLGSLEALLGHAVKEVVPGALVSLDNPEVMIVGVAYGDTLLVGTVPTSVERKGWSMRRPRVRPYFHPSALYPKFARCLVNLTRPARGDVILDPFCGTGSILLEAAAMGLVAIGSDISWRMCTGTLRNIKYYGLETADVIQGDALKLSVKRVDGVVTDIPYGRCASTFKREVETWLPQFIRGLYDLLNTKRYCCIVHPKHVSLDTLDGFLIREEHHIYIHRSLTRTVKVLRRI